VLAITQPGPQLIIKDILKDCRRDGDTDCAPGAAEGVGCRGDDCLPLVVHGRNQCQQGDCKHTCISQATKKKKTTNGGHSGVS